MKKILEFLVAILNRLRHNWVLKLLSFFFAIILWSTVVSSTNPEVPLTADNLNITIDGIEELDKKGLALADPTSHYLSQPVKVSVVLDRQDLEYYDERNITVKLDLSRIHSAGTHEIKLLTFNPVGKTERITPAYITVNVDKKESRIIPVECTTIGEVPEGYYKGDLTIAPDVVHVTGPAQVVNQVEKAQVSLDLNGLTESVNRTKAYTLVDENDTAIDQSSLSISSDSVMLKMDILPIKHFPLIGKNIVIGEDKLKKGYYIEEIEVYPESVAVTGPKDLLENMEISTGAIDVAGQSESIQHELDIAVPQGLTLLSSNTVTVVVRISEVLQEITFEQVPIKLINMPSGLAAPNFDLKADVTIKAPINTANKISASHVSLYVDLQNLEIGEHTLYVNAQIDEEFRASSIKSNIEQATVTLVQR